MVRKLLFHSESDSYIETYSDEEANECFAMQLDDVTGWDGHERAFQKTNPGGSVRHPNCPYYSLQNWCEKCGWRKPETKKC